MTPISNNLVVNSNACSPPDCLSDFYMQKYNQSSYEQVTVCKCLLYKTYVQITGNSIIIQWSYDSWCKVWWIIDYWHTWLAGLFVSTARNVDLYFKKEGQKVITMVMWCKGQRQGGNNWSWNWHAVTMTGPHSIEINKCAA